MADNPIIEQQFTFPIPNEWRSTDFSLGKTGTWTYKGPRFLTFEIDIETGKEKGWCLYEERDLERPVDVDCVRITVDATENDEMALLAYIGNDIGDPDNVIWRTNRQWLILYEAPEGYSHVYYSDQYEPRDIYDEFEIRYDFEEQKFILPVKGWENEGEVNLTWDDVREQRNRMLEETDGAISEDMPDSLKNQWITFRRLLRELPTALAHIPAFQAAKMFPPYPGTMPKTDKPSESKN